MTETWPCLVCEVPTSRGSLLKLHDEWIAVPLCPRHRNAVADVVPPGTQIVDATRPN